MKKHRLPAVGAALALVAGSFALAVPAMAAEIDVPDNSYGAEGDSYPNGWFTGAPQPTTAPVDNASGITLTGATQFLYGGIIPIADSMDFVELVDGSAVDVDGIATFQYPVFFNSASDGNLGFTTIRPLPAGTPQTGGTWFSSQNVTIGETLVLSQGEHTWEEVVDAFGLALELGAAPEVLAVGVFVDPGQTALVRSISFGGNTYNFDVAATAPAPVPTPIATNANFTG